MVDKDKTTELDMKACERLPEYQALKAECPDAEDMIQSQYLRPEEQTVDYWNNVGRGKGGFYDRIREHGCTACGCHTPGCCDACA